MKKMVLGLTATLMLAGAVLYANNSIMKKAGNCCHSGSVCCVKGAACCAK